MTTAGRIAFLAAALPLLVLAAPACAKTASSDHSAKNASASGKAGAKDKDKDKNHPNKPVKTISDDQGGRIADYALRVAKLKKSGERVRIAGRCDSACTLYLGLPTSQICVAGGASFGFHLPFGVEKNGNRAASEYLMGQYPQWVKDWIAQNGGLSEGIITMDYSFACKHIRGCS
jgi:hypothetical protein